MLNLNVVLERQQLVGFVFFSPPFLLWFSHLTHNGSAT